MKRFKSYCLLPEVFTVCRLHLRHCVHLRKEAIAFKMCVCVCVCVCERETERERKRERETY